MTACSFVNFERSVDVELQVQAPSRLFTEIVGHTAFSVAFVEALLVEQAMVVVLGVVHREVPVVERDEHHGLTVGFLRVEIHDQRQRFFLGSPRDRAAMKTAPALCLNTYDCH